MSRALELAEKCGFAISRGGNGYWDNKSQLEAFYHAARAEMAREAADFIGRTDMSALPFEWMALMAQILAGYMKELRAMADREGK